MHCHIHQYKNAVGTCVTCGKFICSDCNVEIAGKNHCKRCLSEFYNENKEKVNVLDSIGVWVPRKSRIAAGILAILFGAIGIHKFYLGRIGKGILYLLFCWTGIPAIVSFFEGIIYFCISDERFASKYGIKYIL